MTTSEEKRRRALRTIRESRGEEESYEEPSESFEAPTAQIEHVLEQARTLSKKFGILLPPPFSPFDSFPKLPASREERTLEKIEKLPKVEEPKVQKEPKITCPKCKSTNSLTAKFCSTCGWDLSRQYRVDPGFTLRK